MLKKKLIVLSMAVSMMMGTSVAYADEAPVTDAGGMVFENCGAYLFQWRPYDCGNGRYFVILAGGHSISESDVILNRGYDYGYKLYPKEYTSPWGEVPELAMVNGQWAIPENQASMPEGSYSTKQMILIASNHNFSTKERYIDIVSLPRGVSSSELPEEARKYLINVDGTDAGALDSKTATGWDVADGKYKYMKPDKTYAANGWIKVDNSWYYMDANGYMLSDTVTPDGFYVNKNGKMQNYKPGWTQTEQGWRYISKQGNFVGKQWLEVDGKWYYFDMSGYMVTNTTTPDGYTVGADGAWDGNPSTIKSSANSGPGLSAKVIEDQKAKEEAKAAAEKAMEQAKAAAEKAMEEEKVEENADEQPSVATSSQLS